MNKNPYFINILLTIVMGISCFARVLIKTFLPGTVLSPLSIPFLVAISVIALVLEYFWGEQQKRQWAASSLLAGVTFIALPVAVGWGISYPIWKLFTVGTVVFFVTDTLYRSIGKRMSSGPCCKLSPIINGVMLYLASQCFQGLL